jgi:enoyl-[acyl-carrier-protein] reductase (NADH)
VFRGRFRIAERIDARDVGPTRAFLATRYARRAAGGTVYVDGASMWRPESQVAA